MSEYLGPITVPPLSPSEALLVIAEKEAMARYRVLPGPVDPAELATMGQGVIDHYMATQREEATLDSCAVISLQPYDKSGPLRRRELRVYIVEDRQPYTRGFDGRRIYLDVHIDGFQYADWRQDDYGWMDVEVTRDKALRLLRGGRR